MDKSELTALKDEFGIFQRKFEKFLNDNEKTMEEPKQYSVESLTFKFNKSQESMLGWACINWECPIILLPINDGCFVGIQADIFDCSKDIRKCVFDSYDSGIVADNFYKDTNDITVLSPDEDTTQCFYLIEPVEGDTYIMKRLKLTFKDNDVSYEAID